MRRARHESGFTLVELLVVMIILAILAAVGIPRFLAQRDKARDATVVSDLRNLIAVEVAFEAAGAFSEDPAAIAARGWEGSDSSVRVCARVEEDPEDVVLTAWHLLGSRVYTYRRSAAIIVANDVPIVGGQCADQGAVGSTLVWPYTAP